jgi:hypothetical protein
MVEAVSMIASALSAVSGHRVWEDQVLASANDRQSQSGLADWVPDYELTH